MLVIEPLLHFMLFNNLVNLGKLLLRSKDKLLLGREHSLLGNVHHVFIHLDSLVVLWRESGIGYFFITLVPFDSHV